MCTKDMAANSDVFLVDHAFSFPYWQVFDALKQTPPLVERLQKIVDDLEKQGLPGQSSPEEEKKEESKETRVE